MTSESRHTPDAPPAEPAAAPPPPRLADLVEDLLWPHLLRTTPLALRASRLAMAFFLLVLLAGLGELPRLWGGPDTESMLTVAIEHKLDALAGIVALAPPAQDGGPIAGFRALLVGLPATLLDRYPYGAIPIAIAMLAVVARLGGAISRSTACEFALGRSTSWRDAMAFSLSRWLSLIGVITLPGVVAGLLALAMLVAGKVFFSLPGLSVLGALLYALALLGAFLGVLLLGAWFLGSPLLIPAVACEGVDALDGVERAFALVFGQPLRLLLYLAILGAVGVISIGAAWLLGTGAIAFAQAATTAWTGAHAEAIFAPLPPEDAGAFARAARSIVGFWESIVSLLVGAFALSYALSGATVMYLLLRRADTGQEHTELWEPGRVEGVMARTIEARAALNE